MKRAAWQKWLWRILRIVLLVYLGVCVLLVSLERFLVYPAPPAADGDWAPQNRIANFEDVWFESEDGTKLHGWYIEHPAAKAQLLFCHGNGEHLGYLTDWLSGLSNTLEVSIFAFDYRGYGKSEGKPFEDGLLADGEAAQRWLATRAQIQPQDVVLYGRSLGGGVVVYLASKLGARALIPERTFHSMVEIGAAQYPWIPVRWLMRNRYPSSQRIAQYDGHLLQVHGTVDRLIPLASARALFDACPSAEKQFIEVRGMGHNDPAPPEFFAAFRQLIDSLH